MDFSLTEEHIMIRDAARDFAQTELLPGVIERDNKQEFPDSLVKKMGKLGFMGIMVDPKYGGSGMDAISYVLIMEELSKIDASASVMVSVNNSLVCYGLEAFGTEDQKQKYLTKLASGEQIGAFCLSEPEAGSDATSQATTAQEKDDHYLINGTKNWITNGGRADVYLVIAQTDRSKKHKGINAFIVEKGAEGFHVGPKEDKLGIRGSDTHTLQFNNVKVPKENRIGQDGFGFKFAMKTLAGGRIGIAAQALGIASGAYELALKYSKERKTFGTEICNHQAIAFKLADMYTEIEAARMLVMKAAWDKDQGNNYDMSGAMAKLYASKVAMEQSVEAVQIHGGNGFVKDYHVERLMRDAKITQIYEGTSEIQKIVISRGLIRG
ncbi:acyl-CoA dehydrogenase [Tenacibaculum finnmarkense]|uniref:Cyclohex-1-ene-1-carbonyl-CoA dehydrogenase n=1 Tax=Tenacibaculum finnmarkense genomovar finnmarkense TaxID=1458503 RepID=A0AAP1RF19_9FLAO|nr:acyl-CoA dehydrogenase [Tenacibaculum finnmarkense]MBE7652760.1 acyl-CoA dehydrogenase [Tenacibaculum finnmarkense genomovar finnmarkense]MBE7660905.1 acyl-CoA dehydrogenase [Tenacibaculum finnmarkense genomovar finnmarkense]MBE7693164.1 acyl-CoA dehydrogenase [Tenacibaculum finnmarkense genomovar finnmarkense]MBE7694963.1 acyl-CoA dehydrogenase [Tenacibaculum finnmarkense genomovar finnmarkense]MCD8403403.1 acyl-CoA dehydrogenase [Tenacibaculum finnmarkense genomovar finnmarkense]